MYTNVSKTFSSVCLQISKHLITLSYLLTHSTDNKSIHYFCIRWIIGCCRWLMMFRIRLWWSCDVFIMKFKMRNFERHRIWSTTEARSSCSMSHYAEFNGPLTRYVKLWVSCAGNAGNVFPATDFKGNRKLAIPACITARACRTCMLGSLNPRRGESVPGIPGACATRNFTYLIRGPWAKLINQLTNCDTTLYQLTKTTCALTSC